jgi:hypothetical protein
MVFFKRVTQPWYFKNDGGKEKASPKVPVKTGSREAKEEPWKVMFSFIIGSALDCLVGSFGGIEFIIG